MFGWLIHNLHVVDDPHVEVDAAVLEVVAGVTVAAAANADWGANGVGNHDTNCNVSGRSRPEIKRLA